MGKKLRCYVRNADRSMQSVDRSSSRKHFHRLVHSISCDRCDIVAIRGFCRDTACCFRARFSPSPCPSTLLTTTIASEPIFIVGRSVQTVQCSVVFIVVASFYTARQKCTRSSAAPLRATPCKAEKKVHSFGGCILLVFLDSILPDNLFHISSELSSYDWDLDTSCCN